MSDRAYDPEYTEFIELFNRERYEESHKALLPAWQQNIQYNFYKALIQLAGAFQHWNSGNAFWAEDLLASAHNLLEKYAPRHQGLRVDRLIEEIRACHEVAQAAKESGQAGEMPRITLQLE